MALMSSRLQGSERHGGGGVHRFAALLACPACASEMRQAEASWQCLECLESYAISPRSAQANLRLKSPKPFSFSYDPTDVGDLHRKVSVDMPLSHKGRGKPTLDDLRPSLLYGNRVTPELVSHFPVAEADDEWMLDLGCGGKLFEPICRDWTGLNYLGIDYEGTAPDLLADAHALPFRDGAFRFILSVAVLEHLACPSIAMSEIARVLKPGGLFIGTVAFLEPFHMNSHYHMTHVGLLRLLRDSGLIVEVVTPNRAWSGLRALAEMALYPGLPRKLRRLLVAVPELASNALSRAKRAIGRGGEGADFERSLAVTGGFRFIARRQA